MTEEQQLAEAKKYSSDLIWHFGELRPGLFVLYTHERKVAYNTRDWNALLTAYQNRAKYVPSPKLAQFNRKLNIDLSQLDLTI